MDDSNVMHDPTTRLDAEIIRRLGLPAPEEPAMLPALVLPIREGSDRLGSPRIRARFLEGHGPSWASSARMVLAVVALLLAAVVATVGGAMRLNLIPNPFDPDAGLRARGISMDIPEGWVRLTPPDPFGASGAFTALIVSNRDVAGCAEEDLAPVTPAPEPVDGYIDGDASKGGYAGRADQIFECVLGKPMASGEIRIVVSHGFPQRAQIGPIEAFEPTDWFGPDGGGRFTTFYVPTEDDGWTQEIDGMPAKLVVAEGSGAVGSDEVRTWAVFPPGGFTDLWFIRASLRGPDLDALRTQVDTIAQSLRFEQTVPALDEARRDEALARAIDGIDRETRTHGGSDLFGCFPRTPGAQPGLLKDRLFSYGPDGPLAEPVPVTCTTSVESTPLKLWHVTLIVSWDAGDGYAAGEWGYETFFDANGTGKAGGGIETGEGVVSPGSVGELPPPLDGPLVIPVGAVVQVLPPGIDWETGPAKALDEHPNATLGDVSAGYAMPGRRLYVVEGPLTHVGTDWYRVEVNHGSFYPSLFPWIPAFDGNRPLIRVVEPRCPSGDVTIVDLVHMIHAEPMLCFGSDQITLDPALLTRVDFPGGSTGIEATPAWLADETPWRLFGRSGPDGVDPALAVAIDPSLGDNVPTEAWLTVRGHFDDPASPTCQRTLPEGWGTYESPDIQVLGCRELFVITSFETRGAP